MAKTENQVIFTRGRSSSNWFGRKEVYSVFENAPILLQTDTITRTASDLRGAKRLSESIAQRSKYYIM
jgi:hypothetical protein